MHSNLASPGAICSLPAEKPTLGRRPRQLRARGDPAKVVVVPVVVMIMILALYLIVTVTVTVQDLACEFV